MDDLSKYSGEEFYKRPPQLNLDMVRLNGKTGQFELRKITAGLKEDPSTGKKAYPVEKLGDTTELVFLRVRRALMEKLKGKPQPGDPRPAATIEHNHKSERVVLFTAHGEVYGTSDELRAQFPDLRTQQIIYVMYNGRLVRLLVKGSSLGSESKAKDVMDFYEYMASFEKNPAARDGIKDHFYDFRTKLRAVEETSQLGGYYTIAFERGEANTDEDMKAVAGYMKAVHEFVTSYDEFYRERMGSKEPLLRPEDETIINYDEEGVEIPDDLSAESPFPEE